MRKHPIELKDFNTKVRPQDDFYHYVNGGWLKRTAIPPSENRWGSFHILHDQNRKDLRALLDGLAEKSGLTPESDEAKLRDLYRSSMNMKARTKEGTAPLRDSFALIESVTDPREFASLFAHLHRLGVGAPWSLGVDQDDKNSKRMVLRIGQGGIGVPERDYLLKRDPESRRIRNAYIAYLEKSLRLEKYYPKERVSALVRTVLRIERRLARVSMTPVERRDVYKLYNKRSLRHLNRQYPRFSWGRYFDELKVPKTARNRIIVNQPIFFEEINRMVNEIPLEAWRVYLHWHLLDAYMGALGEPFITTRFAYYGRALQGLREMPELWKRGVGIADALMGDALGRLYVKKHFSPKAKREITTLVKNLTRAYRVRIRELDWMSNRTKERAFRKLDTMTLQLGYPDKWQSYRKLAIDPVSFARNVMEGIRFDFDVEIAKLLKPTDPREWYMSAPTVNAYYSPNLNQITFPAGILQPPFFYPGGDPAINYGAIGAVIGHELTHGFDDVGSLFDEYGNLRNWWSGEDRKRFEQRAKVLERQFNQYKVKGGIRVNGKLTLGENIADLGGVIIAYRAFLIAQRKKPGKTIAGYTAEQRFFISHAISERCLIRGEFIKFIALNDEHAPNVFRSNGPVSNTDEFYEAFNVSPRDRLFRHERARARIW